MGGKEIEGKLVTESTSILDSRPLTTLISKGTSFIKVNYYMFRKVAVHNLTLFFLQILLKSNINGRQQTERLKLTDGRETK